MIHRYSFHSLARWAGITAWVASAVLIFPAANAALNDTGITTCSNADTNGLPCPVAGFPGQDAEFGTNGFDFTKLDAAGNELPATATDHTCVRDNVTRLMWQVKLSSSTYTFDQAAAYAGTVNAAGLCGFKDWRMPDPKELVGIADHGRNSPAIDTNYFPSTPSDWFWSGSPLAGYSDYAWGVYFGDGYADYYNRYDYGLHVRLVRGGQSFNSFVDNKDGTVTQSNTGLMWAKCSEGQSNTNCTGTAKEMNWSDALIAANNSNLGGYNDWRLPNPKELLGIADHGRNSPAIDTNYFPNMPSDSWWWSGSPSAYGSDYAWGVNFYYGGAGYYSRYAYSHVRLVRGGQSFDSFQLTVTKAGTGSGLVTSSPAGMSCGATCSAKFISGTAVTLTAKADTGAIFSKWTGCTPLAAKPLQCAVTLTSNKTVTAVFGTADIKVTAMTLMPASPAANSTFSAKITVKNQGTAMANGGYLDVWTNQSTIQKCGASSDKWIEIGSLAAGATKTLTVNLSAKSAGSKTLRAFADGWCETSESNEVNNQMTKKYTVK
ncbi:DUF1566 domain-containing protein [Chromatium okenii]|uniref:Lcl domain-containing protein n=1 Tax=Chromatium okenii TaxID=61644 RepID=UPI0026EA21F1|nr:DUF1566 domain-containing protein [Chromatium okenii]MBV5308329.1 DUF1566 domain-containing protein [Chromatium okenii]